MEDEGSAPRTSSFPSGEIAPGIHWIEGWVVFNLGLGAEDERNLLSCHELNKDLSCLKNNIIFIMLDMDTE
jgi:hypothetical protein